MAVSRVEIRDRIRDILEKERVQTENQDASIERIYTGFASIIYDVAVEVVNSATVSTAHALAAPPTGGVVTGTITTTLRANVV